jgi:hypothetical protein
VSSFVVKEGYGSGGFRRNFDGVLLDYIESFQGRGLLSFRRVRQCGTVTVLYVIAY